MLHRTQCLAADVDNRQLIIYTHTPGGDKTCLKHMKKRQLCKKKYSIKKNSMFVCLYSMMSVIKDAYICTRCYIRCIALPPATGSNPPNYSEWVVYITKPCREFIP